MSTSQEFPSYKHFISAVAEDFILRHAESSEEHCFLCPMLHNPKYRYSVYTPILKRRIDTILASYNLKSDNSFNAIAVKKDPENHSGEDLRIEFLLQEFNKEL